jgi:hypothetical protein
MQKIKYKKLYKFPSSLFHKYKYELLEEHFEDTGIIGYEVIIDGILQLSNNGKLRIGKKYRWDGCSGPTWDDEGNMRGSLIHDAFYQMFREKFLPIYLRKKVDQLFVEICHQDGMCALRCHYYYGAVRLLAGGAAK